MKKHKYISWFIHECKPTRKQLQIFCKYSNVIGSDANQLPMINKSTNSSVSYQAFVKWVLKVDKQLTLKQLNCIGYYGTNITQWYRLGNITKKRGKYYLTKDYLNEGISLYKRTPKKELKHYKFLTKYYRDAYFKQKRELQKVYSDKFQEEREQKNINSFLYTMESLIEQYNYLKKSL